MQKIRHLLNTFEFLDFILIGDNGQRDTEIYKNISIEFNDAERATCYYKDNGLGFDIESPEAKKGLGLKNIESRINFINGNFTIQSAINKGTTVTFSF